jgi:hypothetical protein
VKGPFRVFYFPFQNSAFIHRAHYQELGLNVSRMGVGPRGYRFVVRGPEKLVKGIIARLPWNVRVWKYPAKRKPDYLLN